MLVLGESDLRRLLPLKEVIAAVEDGFRALANGEVSSPERLHLPVPDNAVLIEMPCYARIRQTAPPALGTKIVSVFPENGARGLDVVQSVYLLLDGRSGQSLALLEGKFITAIRTAATSAVATKLMARKDSKRLALFGAGVQARYHVEAMREVAEVESVSIVSRTRERAEELCNQVRDKHRLAATVASAQDALRDADLVCTCTTSDTPLFGAAMLRPGTHINAIGSFTPKMRELDTETVRRARVVIDATSAAGREAGEILIPLAEGAIEKDHVNTSLSDLVAGRAQGRRSDDELTVFKSCGLAIEDLVTAQLAYRKAVEQRCGLNVEL